MRLPLFIVFLSLLSIPAIAQPDSTKKSKTNNCDVITLKNGTLIYCKVASISYKKVSYKKCNDTSVVVTTLPADSVLMVNYPNGTSETIKSHGENKDDMRPWVGIHAGAGLPTFHFASPGPISAFDAGYQDFANYVGQDALPGASYNLDGYIPITSPNIGITAEVGYSSNPFDVDAYTHTTTFYSNYNLTGSIPNKDDSVWNESAGNYSLTKYMLGIFAGYRHDGFSLIFSVRLGFATCHFPNISYTYKALNAKLNGDTLENISIDKATVVSTAYQLGMCLKCRVYKIFSLVGNIEYFSCNATFPYNIHGAVPGVGNNDNQGTEGIYVGYRLFNFTAGLAIDL